MGTGWDVTGQNRTFEEIMNFADNDQFLKTAEIAAYLRCSTQTVRRLIRDRKLTAVRVGRNFRVSVKSANEYLRAQSTDREEK